MKYYILNNNEIMDNIFWGEINGPTYVYIEITRKCNCNCDFCQVNVSHEKNIDILMYKSIMEQLKNANCFEIRLGGGEPLLSDDLEKILELSKDFSVWICTNGIKLTKGMCTKLKKYGVSGVRISLDSLNREKHNGIRHNSFAYDGALDGIFNAKAIGLAVCISMTIGAHNVDEVDEMREFAYKNACKFLTHFIMPIGKGKKFLINNPISYEKRIELLSSNYKSERNCVAASQSFSIDIDGNVSACTFLKPVGNVNDVLLKQVLESAEFNKYKHAIPESDNCKKCVFKDTLVDGKCCAKTICKGGCWAFYEQKD